MPMDHSGHRPSFRLHRNGGLYELHARITPPHASPHTIPPPRSMNFRAAKATSHIHAMSGKQAAEYIHRRLHAGDNRI
eukprot:2794581-Pleurochrysis_carterae.AAC.1